MSNVIVDPTHKPSPLAKRIKTLYSIWLEGARDPDPKGVEMFPHTRTPRRPFETPTCFNRQIYDAYTVWREQNNGRKPTSLDPAPSA